MKHLLYLTLFFLFPVLSAAEDLTTKNVQILQEVFQNENPDNAQLYIAAEAVRHLTEQGTPDAVPELKKLLDKERINTAVRTALLNIPGGVDALRESLTVLKGKPLAGVVETLGNVHDEKSLDTLFKLTNDEDEIVAKSAILAAGKIADNQKTGNFLIEKLAEYSSGEKTKIKYAEVYAQSAVYYIDRLIVTGQKQDALKTATAFCTYTADFPEVFLPLRHTWVLLTEEIHGATAGDQLMENLLQRSGKSGDKKGELQWGDDKHAWKLTLDLAHQLKSPNTGKVILNNLKALPTEKQTALIEVIGFRKDKAAVDDLIKIAEKGGELQISAVKALGNIGDLKGLETVIKTLASQDSELAAAGREGLAHFQGEEFNRRVIKLLDSDAPKTLMATLYVVGERKIDGAKEKIKMIFEHREPGVRESAYFAFSQTVKATPEDLAELLLRFVKEPLISRYNTTQVAEMNAMKTIALKITNPDAAVAAIEEAAKNERLIAAHQVFILELYALLGSAKAAQGVAAAATLPADNNEYVADKATELLGKWSSANAAPYLLDIAEHHPVEKYRLRALRGYVRIIRQLTGNLPLEERAEMVGKIEKLAKRDEDKKLVAETKEQIGKTLKMKPIFDGKTFDGWEFRDNKEWFRIEDGAIVGGTMNKAIPKNQFICTTTEYGDFTLRLQAKVISKVDTLEANAGVQIRSQRMKENKNLLNEMIGYQADMTNSAKFWGCLYDESRRSKFLAEANRDEVEKIFRPNEWNDLEIICKGANVKIFLNEKQTVDYTEADSKIPQKGFIGLQIHAGSASEAWYRNIRIEE